MKITFICGCFEQGRDGVGDYVYRLSQELIRLGHEINILALRDSYINEPLTETVNSGNQYIQVLRIPASISYLKCLSLTSTWVKKHNPDWLSLQFVPFSFHTKGLPLYLAYYLSSVGKGRMWHIMFHELWVGMDVQAVWKAHLWGKAQRQIISLIHRSLRPSCVHTQTTTYQKQLQNLGIRSNYLKLFSNIPFTSFEEHPSRLPDQSSVINKVVFVIFGGIHGGSPVEAFTKEVAEYAKENNITVLLRLVGRNGSAQLHWTKVWEQYNMPFEVLGEQTPQAVSSLLKTATIGISTTPFELLEKSGSVAAMLEHGLRVICVSKPWKSIFSHHSNVLDLVIEYNQGSLNQLLNTQHRKVPTNTVSLIAEQFINDLAKCSEHG